MKAYIQIIIILLVFLEILCMPCTAVTTSLVESRAPKSYPLNILRACRMLEKMRLFAYSGRMNRPTLTR